MFDTKLILDFLAELKANNTKEWMDANRSQYERARDEFKSLVSYVLEALKPIDAGLESVSAADCIFRMNRDIRFSADKTPYKTWMSAVMAEGGRHSIHAIYYLHLQPGDESMAAGGMYQPAGEQLRKIRQEVDYNAAELQQIVRKEDFKNNFGEIQGEKLIRAPKGYPTDHPNIELLKLKSYLAIRKFSDVEVLQDNFAEELITSYRSVQPFNEYLNVAIS
jgi:uncharacterized protein (TIGR02453 family)